MPNTTEGLLLAIGGLFLLIGLIGGGFEISAAKIPPVGKKARIAAAVFGLAFLGLAARSITSRETKSPAAAATQASTEQPSPAAAPRTPIDNIFKAWERRDVDLYLEQWHPLGRQWIGTTSRSMAEIAERRRKDFERYRRVQVLDYKVEIDNPASDPVIARVTYSMRFQKPDGTWVNENDFRETYKLTFLKAENRWVIRENFDYFTT